MKLSERIQPESPKPKPRKPAAYAEHKRAAQRKVVDAMGSQLGKATLTDLRPEVERHLETALSEAGVKMSETARRKLVDELASDMLGYGPLDPFLADQTVTEIMCNGPDEIWVERDGRLHRTAATFNDTDHMRQVIEKIVAAVGRRIDESCPMVDARLPDGSRVNAVIQPVAVHAPLLTIRRFPDEPLQVSDLIVKGSVSVEASEFLEACVAGRLNVVVTGGTGTGKTTMLNALSSFIPPGERIVTIEDAAELRLQQPHVVAMESRPANIEGAGQISIRDLVRNALRMRPDRIVVGEVRGGEALDMLQAMNTGHEGSLTTVHANSPRDALSRLETMVLMAGYDLPLRAVRAQIASAVDVIVHLHRDSDGTRRVTCVAEVQGMEGDVITMQDIFAGDFLRATGLRPKLAERVSVPARLFVGKR